MTTTLPMPGMENHVAMKLNRGARSDSVPRRSRRVDPRDARRRRLAAGSSLVLAVSLVFAIAGQSIAAPGTRVDIDPDVDWVLTGSTVVLTASIQDADGNPLSGPGPDTRIRWYFLPGSANDMGGNGNSSDPRLPHR